VQKCSDCHAELINKKIIHYPIEDGCSNCHTETPVGHPNSGSRDIKLVETMPDLCYNCHEKPISQNHIHAPVESGECIACHNVHSSNNAFLLKAQKDANLCNECHDIGISSSKKFKHQPFTDGDCTSCHDAHQSKNTGLLKTETPNLCFDCHDNIQTELSKAHIHIPVTDGCNTCHDMHESSEKFLLAEKTPDLCYNCHETFTNKKNIHGPVKDGNCNTCHAPHGSLENNLLEKESQLICLSCHSKQIITETKTIDNIGLKISTATIIHGAIEIDGCSVCHDAHSSDNQSLLKNKFSDNEYVDAQPDSFALCFDCHDKQIIEPDISPLATLFRNGETNLHLLHIKGKKGRNCNMCHDIHASVKKHLMAETVRFGSWKMPLNYKSEINGGSCATGCHAKKAYVNNTY
jgi:predicted CXXCH cytochrome family protein